jgi:hypothetical protein
MKLRMDDLFLDDFLNGREKVLDNIYSCMFDAAVKFYYYLQELPNTFVYQEKHITGISIGSINRQQSWITQFWTILIQYRKQLISRFATKDAIRRQRSGTSQLEHFKMHFIGTELIWHH